MAIVVHFAAPMHSPDGHRAWITTTPSGASPSTYGDWAYIDDGAGTATLKAPSSPGAYELRLHTDYPVKTTNLAFAVPFTVRAAGADDVTPAAAQRFTLGQTRLHPHDRLDVTFAAPMVALPNEKFWITTAALGSSDETYGDWQYLSPQARNVTLAAPANPGDYEVRLHANYPTRSTHVVYRSTIHVVP
jgi:hypothetical protein